MYFKWFQLTNKFHTNVDFLLDIFLRFYEYLNQKIKYSFAIYMNGAYQKCEINKNQK
jgi:hypothetical protein